MQAKQNEGSRSNDQTRNQDQSSVMNSSQNSIRVRNLNSQKKVTVASMRQSQQLQKQMEGNSSTASKTNRSEYQPGGLNAPNVPHELSKESILKPPRIQPLGQQSQTSLGQQKKVMVLGDIQQNRTAGKMPGAGKPFNRLVPVPPPKGFMQAAAEEEKKDTVRPQKKPSIAAAIMRQSAATSMGQQQQSHNRIAAAHQLSSKQAAADKSDQQSQKASPQMSVQSSKLNKTRASTAKSTRSFYSEAAQSTSEYYLAEKRAGRVQDDDTLSVAEKSMVETCLTQQNVLFDPNEVVEENSMISMIVKQNTMLLQRCLKSKSKDLYYAAIDNLVSASDNFGPALNKHLPIILPMVAKRQDLANEERIQRLKDALCFNGGDDAEKMFERYPLKCSR